MTAVVRPTIVSTKIVDSAGANTAAVDASGVLSVKAPLPLNVSQPGLSGPIAWGCTAIGATPTLIPATPLAGRSAWIIRNVGTVTVYLGGSSVTADQTTTGGFPLYAGEPFPLPLGAGVLLYGIGNGGVIARIEAAA